MKKIIFAILLVSLFFLGFFISYKDLKDVKYNEQALIKEEKMKRGVYVE